MYQKSSLIKLSIVLAGVLFAAALSGCNKQETGQVQKIEKTLYQRVSYETVQVEKGDIEPVLTLTLEPEVVEKIDYSVDEADLKLEEIKVSVGEKVKKGQILVTFEAEELRKSIEKSRNEVEEKQLLLDHYTRLANVEKKKDHEFEVSKLADDVNLAKLALAEEMERLNRCSIRAEKDGTISYISKVLLDGYVAPLTCMITEVCGRGSYTAETEDDYTFLIGDTFKAAGDTGECEMKVIDLTETDTAAKRIVFEPVTDYIDTSGQESFTVTIHKPSLKNVVYIPDRAIQEKDGRQFVYLVSEDGFLDVVFITTGEHVDGKVEVGSGLTGGEEVALK